MKSVETANMRVEMKSADRQATLMPSMPDLALVDQGAHWIDAHAAT